MGLFDGAFGGGGSGILPDWLAFNPQMMSSMSNAMDGGTPAGSFADRWSGVPTPFGSSADASRGLSAANYAANLNGSSAPSFEDMWGGVSRGMNSGAFDPQGANNNAAYLAPFMRQTQAFPGGNLPIPQSRPPEAQQAYERGLVTPGGELPPGAAPTAGLTPPGLGSLPTPSLSGMNLPSGNPFAGLSGGGGPFANGGFDPLGIAGPGQPLGGAADWINNNRTMLALFGAGIAGGGGTGNWNAGLSDALRGAATGSQVDRQQQTQTQSQNAAYQAVKAAGGTEAQALAARSNPEVFKAIAPELFSGWKIVKTGSNPITGDQFMMQGPGGQLRPLDSFVKGGGSAGPGGGEVGGSGMLAAGVKAYDPSLSGDAYLAQFSPELQAAAKAWMAGDVMPTGNPRLQGIAAAAKTVAQTYARSIGQPELASDQAFLEKRKMRTDLASSGPSSMGGILANGKSAFGHLANLSDKFVDLGNVSGPDIPGGAHVATIRNVTGNVILPTSQIKGKIGAVEDNAVKYGQEATKFYAGSGGGVEERLHALKTAAARTSSGEEQAAYLETEKQLMLERLHQKEIQIRGTLGDDYLQRHPVIDKATNQSLAKIDENIARLRGTAPAAAASKAGGVVKWEVGPNGVPRPVSK